MSTFTVGVRKFDGSKNIYEVSDVNKWQEVTEVIKQNVVVAKTILTLINPIHHENKMA